MNAVAGSRTVERRDDGCLLHRGTTRETAGRAGNDRPLIAGVLSACCRARARYDAIG
jgi:hypothetical protein